MSVCVSLLALNRTFTRRQDNLKFISRHEVNIVLDVKEECDYDSNQLSYLQPNTRRLQKASVSKPSINCLTPNGQRRQENSVSHFHSYRKCALFTLEGEIQTVFMLMYTYVLQSSRWKFQYTARRRRKEFL